MAFKSKATILTLAIAGVACLMFLRTIAFVAAPRLTPADNQRSAVALEARGGNLYKSKYDPPDDFQQPSMFATKRPSGVSWKTLSDGLGDSPGKKSTCLLRWYTWKCSDGQLVDSSWIRGIDGSKLVMETALPGWQEALMDMKPGENRRIWIPGRLAYSEDPEAPNGGDIVTDLELIEVVPDEIDPFLKFFGAAGLFLISMTLLYSATNVPPERPEYDNGTILKFEPGKF
eukprot:TRINITY_DN52400_c0_g1_i1.p1 TRINITY_DN52400_c0_g1~~TRINITY_DN52400_c0_g1_i1.p1  ORF type:complete len:230 (-),score=31.77 TRINITY_DN52400_c0_g1_i1:109-798(-)